MARACRATRALIMVSLSCRLVSTHSAMASVNSIQRKKVASSVIVCVIPKRADGDSFLGFQKWFGLFEQVQVFFKWFSALIMLLPLRASAV